MNQVINLPLKVFLKLSNEAQLADEKMKRLKDNMSKSFKIKQEVCDCCDENSRPHYHNVSEFDVIKFSDIIDEFNKDLDIKPKFNSYVDEYLNVSMNLDVKVYMNMVETVNKYHERVTYHNHMVAMEDKEKYAKLVVYGKTKKSDGEIIFEFIKGK